MSGIQKERNDTLVLLAIGGLVVAGAAGLAVIASLTLTPADGRIAGKEPSATAPAPPRRGDSIPEPVVTLATFETATEPEPAVVEPIVEPFAIDPEADPVEHGLEHYRAREFEQSAAYFRAAIESRPGRAWSHYMLGLSLWKSGDAGEAAAAMETAGTIDPASIKTFVNLARIRNDLGEHDRALEAARAAVGLDDANAAARFLEGRSLFNLGRLDEAIAAVEASLTLDPENGYAGNLLGLALIRADRAEEAVPVLERASAIETDVAYIHNNLGMALELTGQRDEAIAAYRAGAEVDPGEGRAAANLARLDPAAAAGDALTRVEPEATRPAEPTEAVDVAIVDEDAAS